MDDVGYLPPYPTVVGSSDRVIVGALDLRSSTEEQAVRSLEARVTDLEDTRPGAAVVDELLRRVARLEALRLADERVLLASASARTPWCQDCSSTGEAVRFRERLVGRDGLHGAVLCDACVRARLAAPSRLRRALAWALPRAPGFLLGAYLGHAWVAPYLLAWWRGAP